MSQSDPPTPAMLVALITLVLAAGNLSQPSEEDQLINTLVNAYRSMPKSKFFNKDFSFNIIRN